MPRTMTDINALTSWVDTALTAVLSDLHRARTILSDAMSRLLTTFTRLRRQVSEEHALFERTLAEVNGTANEVGLIGVLRDVLSRFVDEMVRIGASSVKIMMEVESLRRHSQQVASNGLKIEQIANATRVLSLNARIEASRIGNVGAVFRVVADEIKGLAHQSAELSKAIRDAIDVQSASLSNTSTAVARLAASDFDKAVTSHHHLDATIVKLAEMSAASLQTLSRVQVEADAALQALQFEDMMSQLLQSIADKLETVRTGCRTGDPTKLAELTHRVHHSTVTQQSLTAGGVELF